MTTGTKFTPPHTILIATDLSARCDRALDRAVHLARRWQARLIALSVVEPGTLTTKPIRSMPKPSWTNVAHDPVQHAFNQLRRNALATDVDISLRVEEGKVGEMLNQVAKEEDAGLIVTGIARSESLGLAILGSSVDWLARHATVPVLVVRERSRGPYQSIVVASDYSPTSRLALEASACLFPDLDTTLFHSFTVSFAGMMDANRDSSIEQGRQDALDKGRAFLDESDLSPEQRARVQLLAEHGEPVRLIYEYVRDHDIDLIALGTHGRGALFDILIGSIAKRILETAATDVLLVRDPQRGK